MRAGNSSLAVCFLLFALVALAPASAASFLENGSLEDPLENFVDTSGNYMQLPAGATAITGWNVSLDTVNNIAWAKSPTVDSFSAADGIFSIDLTGFGAESPNGAIQQSLEGLVSGAEYQFSMDTSVNGLLPIVTVGGITVALTAGTPFGVGSTLWTPQSGSFIADSSNPVITIRNDPLSVQSATFIDNLTLTGPLIPEPTSLALCGVAALAGCGLLRPR